MEIDPPTSKYLNPSLLSQMTSIMPPKRKFEEENIIDTFKPEKDQRPFVFKIKIPKKSITQQKAEKSSSSSTSLSSSPVNRVQRQTGGLTLPGMNMNRPKSQPKIKITVKPSPKAKSPRRRKTEVPSPIIINPNQKRDTLYVMGEDVVLQPNEFRDSPLTMRVLTKLGKGAYGEVYQVIPIDQDLPDYFPKYDGVTTYAMKVMLDSRGSRSFEYEHAIMDLIGSKFNDQPGRCPSNVLCYFDISKDKNGRYYMLSEKMDGSISDYADRMKSTDTKIGLALKVFQQTMSGLKELKKVGLLHRDLKEENLLYKIPTTNGRARPSEIVIKIGDFGLSCVPRTKNLACGKGFVGTPLYIDPSILMVIESGKTKDVDEIWSETNDMYSLAVILYQIIFGRYLQDNDWYKMNPNDRTNPKLLRDGYNGVYNRNVMNVLDLLEKYDHSKVEKKKKIANMLRFIIRNLDPFDEQQRTSIDEVMDLYI